MGQRSRRWLSLLCLGALVSCSTDENGDRGQTKNDPATPGDVGAFIDTMQVETPVVDPSGIPLVVAGDLGRVDVNADARLMASATRSTLATVAPMFRLSPDDMRFVRMERGENGYRHLRYQQQHDGLEVVNGDLIVHVSPKGVVLGANGGARGFDVGKTPVVAAPAAQAAVGAARDWAGMQIGGARLVYVIATRDYSPHLAWEIAASGERDGDPVYDIVYVDAISSQIVEVHPRIYNALNREVHNLNHSTSLPGPIARVEGGPTVADQDININYDWLGATYNFYKNVYGRDSFDNAGAKLISSVHYSNNYVNAFWNGTQMVYGDGDGVTASSLARSMDVTSHELTHAVTERTANLVYSYEPGALNEATSDILGECAEAYRDGAVSANTWKVGEDIWTPATPGDALRYMDNPTLDGQSKDFYPERYQGSSDNGGVHLNSGIANLAFYLMSQGGHHPRNKTTTVVTGIGIEKAQQIWYLALTRYFGTNTNFAGARLATLNAAAEKYPGDAAVADAVGKAWEAVGVGGGTTPPPPPPPSGNDIPLQNGVGVSNLAAAQGAELYYKIDVPTGGTSLTVVISGGTGDADLYVKFGQRPTTTSYDYRPYLNGNNETVSVGTATKVGTYYIMLRGYTAFSGVTLKATYQTGTTPPPPGGTVKQVWQIGDRSAGTSVTASFSVPSGAKNLKFTTTGTTGDADLYVNSPSWIWGTFFWQYRSEGSTSTESITPSTIPAGTWKIKVYAYSTYTGVVLTAQYDPQ